MAHAFGAKPPAVAWLGQFFVPLGGVLGGVSTALLLSIVVTQAAILALVFTTCRRLGLSDLAAGVGALLVAASPLFVSCHHVKDDTGDAVVWRCQVQRSCHPTESRLVFGGR